MLLKTNISKFILLISVTFLSCGSDDLDNTLQDCSEEALASLAAREIIATFTDVRGTVVNDEACSGFHLLGGPMVDGRNVERLSTCNLPDSFKNDGLEIIFSGELYETFDTENICAQAFLLTKIDIP